MQCFSWYRMLITDVMAFAGFRVNTHLYLGGTQRLNKKIWRSLFLRWMPARQSATFWSWGGRKWQAKGFEWGYKSSLPLTGQKNKLCDSKSQLLTLKQYRLIVNATSTRKNLCIFDFGVNCPFTIVVVVMCCKTTVMIQGHTNKVTLYCQLLLLCSSLCSSDTVACPINVTGVRHR